MNNKGRQDQTFTCQACGSLIRFKGYSHQHKFCNNKCRSDGIVAQKAIEHQALFERGELKDRAVIYRLLIKRDGNCCSVCSITEWNGKPIRFWVDHIDGNATNNMPSNFRLICPNCDSQSETFGSRNRGNGRKARGLPQYG